MKYSKSIRPDRSRPPMPETVKQILDRLYPGGYMGRDIYHHIWFF